MIGISDITQEGNRVLDKNVFSLMTNITKETRQSKNADAG